MLKKYAPWLISSALWLFALWCLIVSPIHGIADNQDFWRVMKPAGICYTDKNFFSFVQPTYSFCESELQKTSTSAVIPAMLAKTISAQFAELFPIRVLGFFYWLFALCGFFLFARTLSNPWLVMLFSWIYLDPNYFLHFNSFYSEAAWIAVFPWMLWLLQKNNFTVTAPLSLFAALSKLQYALTPVMAALTLIKRKERRWQLGAFLLAAILAALPLLHAEQSIQRMNAYQATFLGPAFVSADPTSTLRKLGVPTDSFDLVGKPVFYAWEHQRYSLLLTDYLDSVSRWKLLGAYLSDNSALQAAAKRTQDALLQSTLPTYGHFEPSTGLAGQQFQVFWQFSQLRDALYRVVPLLLWLAPVLALLLSSWALLRRRAPDPLLIFLCLFFWTQIPIAILGDGFYSLSRHLIGARLAGDFLLVCVAQALLRLKKA